GRKWVAIADLVGSFSLSAQAKNNAGRYVLVTRCSDGARTQWHVLQNAGVGLEVLGEVDTEVGEGEVGDRNAAGQIFQIDDGILQLEQLLAAVFQIVHRVAGLRLDQVLFPGGGYV